MPTFEVIMRNADDADDTTNFIIEADSFEQAIGKLVAEYGWQHILAVAVEPYGFIGPGYNDAADHNV